MRGTIPECTARPPVSELRMWQRASQMIASPGRVCRRQAMALAMVAEGRKMLAALPSNAATCTCKALVVGSSPRCSSPTTAWAIACRMPGVGWVTVSLYRSIIVCTLLWGGHDEVDSHAQGGYSLYPQPPIHNFRSTSVPRGKPVKFVHFGGGIGSRYHIFCLSVASRLQPEVRIQYLIRVRPAPPSESVYSFSVCRSAVSTAVIGKVPITRSIATMTWDKPVCMLSTWTISAGRVFAVRKSELG